MDFRQLQYIIKVAECGNITKAASELYIAQPSLSNYISKVERELGVLLFDRTTIPIRPTLAGEAYIKDAKKILYIDEQLQKKLHDISSITKGTIRIGIPYERGSLMLPMILPEFRQEFPETTVDIMTASSHRLKEALADGSLDFFILPFPEREPEWEYIHIYQEELFLCAGAGFIQRQHLLPNHSHTVDISKCCSLPFIGVESGHAISDTVDSIFPSSAGPRNFTYTAYGVSQAVRMAASGIGVTIAPRMTFSLTRYDPSAQIYSIGDPPLSWEVCAVYRRDAYLGKAERAFIRIAQEKLSGYSKELQTNFIPQA